MKKKIKILFLGIVIILVFRNASCFKLVDGPMKFHIEGFEEFFDLESPNERDEYINEGKLDAYKREGIILIPFIKESVDGCVILLQPYSTDSDYTIEIGEVLLTSVDGKVISYKEDYGNVVTVSKWKSQMMVVNEFKTSEEWFYNGNNLILHIKASVKKGNQWIPVDISYNMTLIRYKGPAWQV